MTVATHLFVLVPTQSNIFRKPYYCKSFKKMQNSETPNKSPENPSTKEPEINENGHKNENLFSPRFRSVAAMAGWDEEALLIASLIVEDTPDRQFKHKRRSDLQSFKTPPTNSRRKRKAQKRSPAPVVVLDLDEDDSKSKQENEKIKEEANITEEVEKKRGDDEVNTEGSGVSNSIPAIPCIDRLREELSCAICLEICYEPSTTPCGHSFCKKCLRSSADRCGKKCPKCRQLISNSRYCTVNTVLWNTIQLLFPQEVEARKAAESSPSDSNEPKKEAPPKMRNHHYARNRAVEALNSPPSENRDRDRRTQRIRSRSSRASGSTTTAELPIQDEDAALALRLQREEFMEAFRVQQPDDHRNSFGVARANLRAMASRAINIRIRGRNG